MERFRILSAFLPVAAVAALCAPVAAQTDQNASTPQSVQVSEPAQRRVPFSLGSGAAGAAVQVEFRSMDRMSQQDRDLAAGAISAIGERAELAGLEFGQVSERGKWEYQQIVCPALPNHLFLQFTRDNGKGDVSIFSASIPRGGGQVRIIPILRRGYSPYSLAGANQLTIAVFNRIRAEEHSDKDSSWLGTGLCYGALAGAHPEAGRPEASGRQNLFAAPASVLMIPKDGGAVISFRDLSANPLPMIWTMTFDGKGKLVEVSQTQMPAAQSSAKMAVLTPAEVQGKAVPEAPANPTAAQSPAAQSSAKAAVLTPAEVGGKVVPEPSAPAAIPVPSAQPQEKGVPPAPADLQGKPVPAEPADLAGKPVPQ